MFTPLSTAILRGELSSVALARKKLSPEKLQQATRRLHLLPDSAEGVASCLHRLFAEWQVCLRLPASCLPATLGHLCPIDHPSVLCRLRMDEMECALHISYSEAPSTVQSRFYEALLHAEARWLKQRLRHEAARLASDADARWLLCRALDEIYALGAEADEAARVGFQPEVCLQLKGALASLYLDVSLEFGHLLQPEDYLDYRTLLSDARYSHAVNPRQEWEYTLYSLEGEVRGLVASDNALGRQAEALSLYARMQKQCAGMDCLTPSSSLCRGMILLENFLFCLFCDFLTDQKQRIGELFCREQWSTWEAELRGQYCSAHLWYKEARDAYHATLKQLGESYFTFLAEGLGDEGSIPRRLRAYLRSQQQLYGENYGCSFVPLQSKTSLSTAQVTAKEMPTRAEIHQLLAFIDDEVGRLDEEKRLRDDPSPSRDLERAFYDFLMTHSTASHFRRSIKIAFGMREVIYGAIFHYCGMRKENEEEIVDFLHNVCAKNSITTATLKSNVKRYRDSYYEYLKEHNLPVPFGGKLTSPPRQNKNFRD